MSIHALIVIAFVHHLAFSNLLIKQPQAANLNIYFLFRFESTVCQPRR